MTQTSKIGFGELRTTWKTQVLHMCQIELKKKKDIHMCFLSFLQLKVTLAPCIEGLILLDRLCYLKEQVKKIFGVIKLSNPA